MSLSPAPRPGKCINAILPANFQLIYNQFIAYGHRSLVRLGMDDAKQQAQLRGLLANFQPI